jgi:hypothetical protein
MKRFVVDALFNFKLAHWLGEVRGFVNVGCHFGICSLAAVVLVKPSRAD